MQRLRTPAWRIIGSFLSWFLFVFSFAALFQTAGVVIGLGGFCASGGPYVIETECPESVVLFAPLGIFGMVIAVGIGLIVAGRFGTPLTDWAWPILFTGLGVQFILGATLGVAIITNVLLGVMFIVMGLFPLVVAIRAGVPPLLLGAVNVAGEPFAFEDRGRRSYIPRAVPDGEPVDPTPLDGVIALGLTAIATVLGIGLSTLAFHAVGVAG
jgi:hypothetical protein